MPHCYSCKYTHGHAPDCKKILGRNGNCHKCGQPGHKAANCPSSSSSSSSSGSGIKCHKCGLIGHYKDQCPSNSENKETEIIPTPHIGKFISASIELDGMWGDNSAYVKKGCDLYRIKHDIMKELEEKKIIGADDMDERNKTHHINISGDNDLYRKIDNTSMNLDKSNIRISDDLIKINIDHVVVNGFVKKLDQKIHFTIFKKDFGDKKEEVKEIVHRVIGLDKEEVKQEDKPEIKQEDAECCICMANKKSHACVPCGHQCVCETCSTSISKCPICRTKIEKFIKVFN